MNRKWSNVFGDHNSTLLINVQDPISKAVILTTGFDNLNFPALFPVKSAGISICNYTDVKKCGKLQLSVLHGCDILEQKTKEEEKLFCLGLDVSS